MRNFMLCVAMAIAASISVGQFAQAGGHGRLGCRHAGGCYGGACGGAGAGTIEGLDPWFNCGCNGSYKFPVPPLYTYHWPGMFSHQLMTDYHSPWRFPPLKPYTDEFPPVGVEGAIGELTPVSPASHLQQLPASRTANEPMSAKMQRHYR